ncbi:hypothetical protein G7Y89_g7886 [Cudoniella acicularis]|uniref:AB hydrolase-1 domain-containing protein n=1 Tax=Cudoniella acicularis TaxID=354080 RepID=A0A8H4RKC6_9HELO|nr:hypothetical protein G7Y89_g7886 [Cudoniella acicularis]
MGGEIAQPIAGRKKIPGLSGLVLLAPTPPTPLILSNDMQAQQISAYDSAEAAEFVVMNVLTSSPVFDEDVQNLVTDMLKGNEWAKRGWPAYAMGEDILEQAKGIGVPVLVIAGEKDRVEVLKRVEREVVDNIGESKMVVLEGKGHLLPVEATEEVAKHIEGLVDRLNV